MAVSNKLTAGQVKTARPKKTAYKLSDGLGMYLRVSPTGHKSWRRDYRDKDGKRKTAVLGEYPDMTLAQARDALVEDRKMVRGGQVPSFGECAESYWRGRQDVTPKTRKAALRALEVNLPDVWAKPINEATRQDLAAGLSHMNERGKYDYAKKTRRYAGQVFRWAGQREYTTSNPAELITPRDFFGRHNVKHFAAISPEQAGQLLRKIRGEGDKLGALAAQFLAFTWVRTNELLSAEWSEIEGDVWRIPEDRMKSLYGEDQEDHWVPLPVQALALLDTLWKIRLSNRYIFPNSRYPHDRPASENLILSTLYRLKYKGKMTGHGFRSLASTWAYEGDREGLVIEAALAHKDENNSRRPYNRARYIKQRRQLLQDYADWLEHQCRSAKD